METMATTPGGTSGRGSALRTRLVASSAVADEKRDWPPHVERIIAADARPADTEQGAWRPIRIHGGPGSLSLIHI
mgnify:FL=1